jgi:hypothetical protein
MHRWHSNWITHHWIIGRWLYIKCYNITQVTILLHTCMYTNTQSNNTLRNKTIHNYTAVWVKSELPGNCGVSFSPFSGTKLWALFVLCRDISFTFTFVTFSCNLSQFSYGSKLENVYFHFIFLHNFTKFYQEVCICYETQLQCIQKYNSILYSTIVHFIQFLIYEESFTITNYNLWKEQFWTVTHVAQASHEQWKVYEFEVHMSTKFHSSKLFITQALILTY